MSAVKRVLVAVSVPDEYDTHDVSTTLDAVVGKVYAIDPDTTVWEWPDFWKDADDGLIGPDGDGTATPTAPSFDAKRVARQACENWHGGA